MYSYLVCTRLAKKKLFNFAHKLSFCVHARTHARTHAHTHAHTHTHTRTHTHAHTHTHTHTQNKDVCSQNQCFRTEITCYCSLKKKQWEVEVSVKAVVTTFQTIGKPHCTCICRKQEYPLSCGPTIKMCHSLPLSDRAATINSACYSGEYGPCWVALSPSS